MRMPCVLVLTLALPTLASAQQPCTTDARRVVDAIYRQVLERGVDNEGANWAAELTGGESVRELVRTIAKSSEHYQRFVSGGGQAGHSQTVTYIYRHLLGRAPDASGLQSNMQALASGKSVDALVDNLIDSAEYQQAYGTDTVPGARIRYCPSSNSSTNGIRFEEMDRNRNRVIERGEWSGSPGSFAGHDWNGDGELSNEELRRGARRTARPAAETDFDPAGPATWTVQAFREINRNNDSRITSNEWYYSPEYFRRADRNRDGSLSLAEFTGTAMDDDRDDRFDDLDVNRNGRVERGEWHGSLDAFGWLDRNRDNVLSREEVVGTESGGFDTFAGLDVDQSGTLSFDEWRWSRRSFDQSDTNRNGALTRQEFAAGGGSPAAR
jgi:Ca2+-binding EF-hand superfamily protein